MDYGSVGEHGCRNWLCRNCFGAVRLGQQQGNGATDCDECIVHCDDELCVSQLSSRLQDVEDEIDHAGQWQLDR